MLNVYPPNETAFSDNGLKILNPLKALVRKEDNGEYYIEIKDTLVSNNSTGGNELNIRNRRNRNHVYEDNENGRNKVKNQVHNETINETINKTKDQIDDTTNNSINNDINNDNEISNLEFYQAGNIVIATTPWGKQRFRLTNPSIENNKIIVRGNHIFFDSANYIIKDSNVVDKNCNDALDHLNSATDIPSPFSTISDITSVFSYRCVRKSLQEAVADIIDRWGGHLTRDNMQIGIRQEIGQDRGIVLSYGKNIINIKSQENWSETVTKLMPVGKDGLLLPESWLTLDEVLYDIPYTKVVHFEQNKIDQEDYVDGEGNPDVEGYNSALENDLRTKGLLYLNQNCVPKVSYSLSAYLKNVSDVGDKIYVKHPKCKLDLETKVIALEYDVILDRITKVEFGNFKNTLKNLVKTLEDKIETEIEKIEGNTTAKLQKELEDATNKINGMLGNSYVIYDGSQILVLDKLPKEEAVNVMRINSGGIGFSKQGINGTFNSVWTIDGEMILQNLTSINIIGDMIKGGTIKVGSNLDESGRIEVYDSSNRLICDLDKDGVEVFCNNGSIIRLNANDGLAGYDVDGNKFYQGYEDEFTMTKGNISKELTISEKLRFIPISTDSNTGIGVVAMV
ncbi:MAG: phage tail protein [Oscillospiraceae bacterium]|jgi:phage minor structural protein|nr:phage tail protein [Oscillospiraceae bacterium]